jgi:hypothetical protein
MDASNTMGTCKTRNTSNGRNKGSTRNAKRQQGCQQSKSRGYGSNSENIRNKSDTIKKQEQGCQQEQGMATVRTSETKVTPSRSKSRDASRSRGWQQ